MKRVLIIKSNSLFSSALECLLDSETGLSLQRISFGSPESLKYKLESFQPEVLVLDTSVSLYGRYLLRDLLVRFPDLPFIIVSAKENKLRLYVPQEMPVTYAGDLANIVRNI